MREAGVDVRYYNRLGWLNLGHMNNRTHRNLMVVDGKTGFIGGVGIADCWRGNAQDSHHYPKVVEPAKAQSFTSAPRSGSMCMQLLYLMSITAAEESSDLSASYFVPGLIAIASLVAAAGRRVRICIIVPGRHMDRKLARRASRSTWGELLAAGVRICEYQRTMFHRKVKIVNHMWVRRRLESQ